MVAQGVLADRHNLSCELTEHRSAILPVQDHVIRGIAKYVVHVVINRPLAILHKGRIQLLRRPALVGVAGDLVTFTAAYGRSNNGDIGGHGGVGHIPTIGVGFGGIRFGRMIDTGLSRSRGLLPCRRIGLGRPELVAAATGHEGSGQHEGSQNGGYDPFGFHICTPLFLTEYLRTRGGSNPPEKAPPSRNPRWASRRTGYAESHPARRSGC